MVSSLRYSLRPLLAGCALLVLGCAKDPAPAPPTRTELLTKPKWRMTAATSWNVTSGTKTTDDFYATVPACRRDDYMQFYADKTYLFDEGATKCRSIDLQSSKSTWYFGPNDATLYFGTATGSDTWQITQLTTTTLQIARQYKAINGTADTYGEDVTYTAF